MSTDPAAHLGLGPPQTRAGSLIAVGGAAVAGRSTERGRGEPEA